MLGLLARSIAYVLFLGVRVRKFIPSAPRALGFVLAFAGGAALFGSRFSPMASFISAQGTTATKFSSGGAAGTGAFEGLTLDTPAAGTLAICPVQGDNVTIGNAGNTVQFNVFGQGINLVGNGGNTLIDNSGGQQTVVTASGGGSIHVGDDPADPAVQIGDNSGTANQGITIGSIISTTTNFDEIDINAGTGNIKLQSQNITLLSGGTSDFIKFGVSSEFALFNHGAPIGEVLLYDGIPLEISQSILLNATAVHCTTGGTQTIAAGVPFIVVDSGTLGSNCILDFGTNATNQVTDVDTSGITLGATFGLQFKNGTASSAVYTSGSTVTGKAARVLTHGTNTLAVSF